MMFLQLEIWSKWCLYTIKNPIIFRFFAFSISSPWGLAQTQTRYGITHNTQIYYVEAAKFFYVDERARERVAIHGTFYAKIWHRHR